MSGSDLVKAAGDQLPAAFDYGEDTGGGFEKQGANEMMIPFLSLLQGLSPQCQDGGPEGAKPGRFFNTVTEDVLTGPILFVPGHFEHVFVEWKPRTAGGGFVARYTPEDPIVRAIVEDPRAVFGKYKTKDGNDLIETFYLYGVLCPEGEEPSPIAIAFTSTKIKVFRRWNTQVSMVMVPNSRGEKVRPPRWAHLVSIGSTSQKNAKGTFYNLTLSPAKKSAKESLLPPDDPRYISAKAIREMVVSGLAKAAIERQNVTAVDPAADEGGEEEKAF